MDSWKYLLFQWMLIYISLTTIAGEEFTCFRKLQQPWGLCSGLISGKKTDNPEKCCTGKGAGFTLEAVVKVHKNRYQCESCESWLRQKNGITTPSVPKFTCFRKFKKDHCSGLVLDELSNLSPKDCCEGKGHGFAKESLKTIGKNKYECVSCNEWKKQTSAVTTQPPSTTTKGELTIGNWGPWGPCSTSCGAGWRSRYRDCINCDKNHYENVMSEPCVIKLKCPLHGSWGAWSKFTVCSATCGRGTMMRNRLCDNPPPANGGANCPGQDLQHRPCENRQCPQDGGWSEWSEWSNCPATCGTGSKTRSRECNSPRPLFGGRDCIGQGVGVHECDSGVPCPIDGNWGPWTSFGPCRASKCESGFQMRSRACNNPRPQNRGRYCIGSTVDRFPCSNLEGCLINGDWCNWESWSTCAATCLSVSSIQVRNRQCLCPPPQLGGAQCEGK
ncbi:hypothetical protein CHS0354_027828 [Potamilus streckersoni]|uniref:Properdin n=1 Tax=Potamilus streckersoni TaxID=2493646 RepID=A0AAE0T1P2_9BIVA|nr:hypothetical protein CHS0354_027828 [Potamilus streckersoni]